MAPLSPPAGYCLKESGQPGNFMKIRLANARLGELLFAVTAHLYRRWLVCCWYCASSVPLVAFVFIAFVFIALSDRNMHVQDGPT